MWAVGALCVRWPLCVVEAHLRSAYDNWQMVALCNLNSTRVGHHFLKVKARAAGTRETKDTHVAVVLYTPATSAPTKGNP